MTSYRVQLADSALAFIAEHVYSNRVLKKFELYADLLSQYPALGAVYDPDYPTARPPITCRSIPIPETPFTMYYGIDEVRETVTVFYIEFKGADPLKRFWS